MTEITPTCKSCHDPLILTLDPEEEDDDVGAASGSSTQGQTVPDDLHLPCGCHFHWQCLLDQSASVTASLACPSCSRYLATPNPSSSSSSSPAPPPSILTTYTNEGGVQPALDIYPALLEESYLAAHPEARPARALHTLAAEGDTRGLIGLLADLDSGDDDNESSNGDSDDEDSEEGGGNDRPAAAAMTAGEVLTWCDPLNGGRSALHVALESGREEVVWLLLWLGSGVPTEWFPEEVVQAAEGMRLSRAVVGPGRDVRFVRDERGRTARDMCLELGGMWGRFVEGGLFG